MANIRVYELAKDLNMKPKALLDRLSDMDVSVRSHMSSIDGETAATIKAQILGSQAGALDESRAKPTVIRRRKKRPAEVEPPPVEETDADQPPETASPVEAEQEPEPTEPAPGKEAPETEAEEIDAAGTPIEEAPVEEKPAEAPSTKPDQEAAAPEETEAVEPEAAEKTEEPVKASAQPIEAREEEAPPSEATVEAKPPEGTAAADEAGPTAQEPVEAAAEPQEIKEPESPAEKTEPSKPEPEKPATKAKKKAKKGKKETPAKIIKLPTKPPAAPKERTPEPEEPAAAGATPPAAQEAGQPADAAAKDKKRKKRGKRGAEEPEKAEGKAKETRWAKKKISFKDKAVVEGADLYAGGGRSRKGRKGQKTKVQQQPQKPQITTPKAIKRRIKVDDTIVLADLAKRMGIKANEIIMKLMGQGVMVTVNQTVDYDTAALVAAEFGYEVERAAFEEDAVLKVTEETVDPEKMAERPPVVTIMGHVDHGKTSLLDVIRKTKITEHEAGGITQHIGAYHVATDNGQIVFLDTPGHEAFTSMRARGATVTDIVVLVVAADDGVMPQTIEAINHSRAAEVPIIVAVNKMDKAGADPDRVYRELSEQGLVPEDWGGDTIFVKVSAKQPMGLDDLLEMILLQSEVLELKANPEKLAVGYVVEAKLDAGRGPVATILVQDGTLHSGDAVVCGVHHGKIRAMLNDRGIQVESAGPSIPVEILGLSGVPNAGDELVALADDKSAKQVSDHRAQKQRSKELAKTSRMSLEKLFERMQEGEVKDLNIILKADVHGSIEALRDSLTKLSNEEVAINVIHAATGTITESDVSLAAVSDAIIIGFNVRPTGKIQTFAQEEHVDMRFYNVIYNAIKDIQDAILGMMSSTYEEHVMGRAEIREIFHVPKVGAIAGCYVTDGKIQRNAKARLVREGVILYEGKVGSLRRYKEDVKEVQSGYECGIGIENYNDIKLGDTIECFYLVEIKPEIQ